MSRTFRKIPHSCVRSPRGRKQAIINDARKGAIPPDAWDDQPHNKECWTPQSVAYKLSKRNFSIEEIIHILIKKFSLTYEEAQEVTRWIM